MLRNMAIAPKLGILVGATLIGLCVACGIASYLMKQEMFNARVDQTKAIVTVAKNMAGELKRQVDAGEMTKDQAMAMFRKLGNAMTYDNGSGYLFATGYDGITQLAPDPKQVGINRMDVVTNGRKLSQELMDGVRAKGEILLPYEYVKPGQETPIRKIGYAIAVPGFDMFMGTGAYLDDLDAKLRPIVRKDGAVTAGNASGVNDGACAMILASEAAVKEHGLTPRARVLGMATAGVEPRIMGIGPVPATHKLSHRLNFKISEVDAIELNEAFASQALAVLRQLHIGDDAEHVNANGGAIALGHPLGASGARLALTLTRRLEWMGGKLGLATLCVGVGQGVALAVERVH